MVMPHVESGDSRHPRIAVGKDSDPLPSGNRPQSLGGIAEQLESLYAKIRGSPYANGLNEAKKAFHAKNYAETLRLTRGTAEIYRQRHLQSLRQDAEGGKEAKTLREKQAKIRNVLEEFDVLLERLERMAKLKSENSPPPAPASHRTTAARQPPHVSPLPKGEGTGDASAVASIIDSGSFTQLQTAAQQSGLVPNADAIGFVREHEFRVGKYREAFDRIEAIYIRTRAAAEQRLQRLRIEETAYRSGVLKMSPKEWMQKAQRDTAQSQIIDRTIRYFLRVLDGLRILAVPPQ
jgi:hypothetical protein